MTRNVPPQAGEAIAKYKEFHRYDPKQIGWFPDAFRIPTRMYRAGRARWVTYRSGKVDPATLRKPPRPVNYIHEHDAGVVCYVARSHDHEESTDVPARFCEVPALTKLGACLGFCFEDADGQKCEAKSVSPYPDLYTTPDGKCLLVIQSKRSVLAMIWGGGLGVFGRGIDG
jgi:hypothetical protein